MAISKKLTVGIHHIRIKWFSFRLVYLKVLINILGLRGVNPVRNDGDLTVLLRMKNKIASMSFPP